MQVVLVFLVFDGCQLFFFAICQLSVNPIQTVFTEPIMETPCWCTTPRWRPQNSVNIWNLISLSKRLIICTEQTSVYISTFPNALTSEKAQKVHTHPVKSGHFLNPLSRVETFESDIFLRIRVDGRIQILSNPMTFKIGSSLYSGLDRGATKQHGGQPSCCSYWRQPRPLKFYILYTLLIGVRPRYRSKAVRLTLVVFLSVLPLLWHI